MRMRRGRERRQRCHFQLEPDARNDDLLYNLRFEGAPVKTPSTVPSALSMPELLDRFQAVREETVAIVEAVQDADLDREGRHVFLGPGRLERFLRWAYEHARVHEEDVRRALAGKL